MLTKIKRVHVLKVHWLVRVLSKEWFFKSGIFIVDVNCFSEDVWGIDLRIQVYKGVTAADETVTEEEMDSLLCGNVSVSRHSREQLLDCMLSRGVLWEPGAKLGQSTVVRSGENLGLACVFANVRDGRLMIEHGLHVDIGPPSK
jgi:hypothetical protein